MRNILKGQSPLHLFSSLQKKGKNRFRLLATYFLCAQKVGKNAFRGENTDSTSGAEVRALAHSIFPLKTPDFYGDAIKKCVRLLPARGNRIPCYLYLSLPLQW